MTLGSLGESTFLTNILVFQRAYKARYSNCKAEGYKWEPYERCVLCSLTNGEGQYEYCKEEYRKEEQGW
jgi:hypothetical protein